MKVISVCEEQARSGISTEVKVLIFDCTKRYAVAVYTSMMQGKGFRMGEHDEDGG